MVRAFTDEAVPSSVVDGLLNQARRVPSAGNTQGVSFLVLDTPERTARYWDITLPAERRAGFAWPGLLAAPVLVVVLTSPDAYAARYAEPDKAASLAADQWPVPYWFVDGGMAVLALLQGLVDVGLGGCFFGLFEHEQAVLEGFRVAGRAVGTVALGHPAPSAPGRSAGRPRPAIEDLIIRP